MSEVKFRVIGDPAPQGSKTPGVTKSGKPFMRETGGKHHKDWRRAVRDTAADVRVESGETFDGPLSIAVLFRFRMPKSRPRHMKLTGWWWKDTTPDADKLMRAVGDALKDGGLIADDARFADVRVRKVEIHDGWLGCHITLRHLPRPGSLIGRDVE